MKSTKIDGKKDEKWSFLLSLLLAQKTKATWV
jgi:hypothetical protein